MKRLFFLAAIIVHSFFLSAGPTEDLITAITNGDVAAVKSSIANGADVNGTDKNGYTAIMLAVWYPEIVNELIAAKADVNKSGTTVPFSYTPLTFATTFGITETIELLVNAGADVNLKNSMGNSPLFAAVSSGKLELLKYLVSKGADPKTINGFNQNLLMMFASSAKTPEEKVAYYRLLEEMTVKAGNKVPEMLKKHQDESLFTPLKDQLEYILSFGFNMNEETDVMVPSSFPNAQMINDANKKAKAKQSAATIAFNSGFANADVLGALLSKGAVLNKKSFPAYFSSNRFPDVRIQEADALFIAVRSGNIELVKTLLQQTKMNINKGYDGYFTIDVTAKLKGVTVLMLAAAKGDRPMCEFLVSMGASGMSKAEIKVPVGYRPTPEYALKALSFPEHFASTMELKEYLKTLVK